MSVATTAIDEQIWLPLERLAPMIRAGTVSPVALTEAVLARIERLEPVINAYITISAGSALTAARQAEAEIAGGRYRGPLHGVPVSLKDLFATRGVLTSAGSRILGEWVPDYDAAVVERLRAAGAIVVGKTNLHEFALGGTTINPHVGSALNPWDTARVPGGSSGGSAAAVAAGLSVMALGSETGNSIRRPAGFCGVVGLKPTYGRISRHGVLPAAWSLDHVGLFTRSARGAAMTLDLLAGPDHRDHATAGTHPPVGALTGQVEGLRVGVPEAYLAGQLSPAVEAAFDEVCRVLGRLGVAVRTVALPSVRYTAPVSSVILLAEAAAWHAGWLDARPEDYGADVRHRLQIGRALTTGEYLTAQRMREVIRQEVASQFREVDLLIAPTTPAPAPLVAESPAALNDLPYADGPHAFHLQRLFSLLGLPALSTPCGFTPEGLPLGLQIAGRPFEERAVLEVAAAYEDATNWFARRPPTESTGA